MLQTVYALTFTTSYFFIHAAKPLQQMWPLPRDTVSSVHLNAIRGAAALVVLLGHTRSLFFSSLNAADHPLATAQRFSQNAGSARGPVTMGNEAVIIFLFSAACWR